MLPWISPKHNHNNIDDEAQATTSCRVNEGAGVQAPGSRGEATGTRQVNQPYPFFQHFQIQMLLCFYMFSDGRQDPARSLWQAQRALLQHSRRSSEVSRPTKHPESQPPPTLLILFYRTARNSKPIEVLGQ